ncbi:MAG: hypothetical protein V3W33_02280 [Gammaproteobacteria bacterium]|jgi:hypothetical protein
MSNYIDEAERRAELYNEFTPRERLLLEITERVRRAGRNKESMRSHLHPYKISDADIEWLRRTGRLV